jgi:hypothetical protein
MQLNRILPEAGVLPEAILPEAILPEAVLPEAVYCLHCPLLAALCVK